MELKPLHELGSFNFTNRVEPARLVTSMKSCSSSVCIRARAGTGLIKRARAAREQPDYPNIVQDDFKRGETEVIFNMEFIFITHSNI